MPSTNHEIPLEIFRNRPALAPELLKSVFGLKIPDSHHVFLGSEALTSNDPTEFRCDATIIMGDSESPDLAIVVEVQLRPDPRKSYTWPVYLATLRSRHKCPVTLMVVCRDSKSAAACAEPIEMGHPDWILRPLVLSPERIPVVTDPAEARRLPELAVLGTLVHADGPDQAAVLGAFCAALDAAKDDKGGLYYDYVVSQLSVAARATLEELMSAGSTYEYKSDFARQYFGEGKAEGEAKAIFLVLSTRGLRVSDEVRTRITSCTDLDQLEIWIQRSATVDSAEDLFG